MGNLCYNSGMKPTGRCHVCQRTRPVQLVLAVHYVCLRCQRTLGQKLATYLRDHSLDCCGPVAHVA